MSIVVPSPPDAERLPSGANASAWVLRTPPAPAAMPRPLSGNDLAAAAVSIAKKPHIGQNPKYGTGAGTRLRREIAMNGVAKALLKAASVIVLLSGGLLLLPSPASAQFPFPNIQFRVPYYGGGGGGGGHYRSRHHKAHERRSHGEPDEDEPAEHAKSAPQPQPMSAPVKDTPPAQPAESQPPAPQGGAAPPKPADEEPSFSPSR
jgi:hypothetical protein